MKKKCIALIVALTLFGALAGCIKDVNGPGGEGGSSQLVTILDSSAFLFNFDDINAAIATAEKQLADNVGSPSETQKVLTQKQIDNTKLMASWAAGKGKTVKSVDWGWGDPLTQKLSAAFISKTGPDIICGEGQLPSFMEQGVLEPFPAALTAYIKANVAPMAYSTMMDSAGKIYGIALDPSNTILAWNKQMLTQAGVAQGIVENGPATWAEWESAMQKVSELNNSLKMPGGVYYAPSTSGYLRVGALLNGNGGGFIGTDGKPSVNTAANGEALEFVKRTAQLNKFNTALKGTEAGYFSAFKGGNLAYIVDGVWALQENSGLTFDVGYSLIPGKTVGSHSNMLLGAAYHSVPTYSKNKELAFQCIERILQADIQQNIADGGLRTPVLTSVSSSAAYQAKYPALYEFARLANEEQIRGLPPFAKAGDLTGLWDAFGLALNKVTTSGNTTPIFSTDATLTTLLKTAQSNMLAAYNS
jgi:multiple sugar transport system substrate-binding protein